MLRCAVLCNPVLWPLELERDSETRFRGGFGGESVLGCCHPGSGVGVECLGSLPGRRRGETMISCKYRNPETFLRGRARREGEGHGDDGGQVAVLETGLGFARQASGFERGQSGDGRESGAV